MSTPVAFLIGLLAGLLLGLVVAFWLRFTQSKNAGKLAEAMRETLKGDFATLSLEALSQISGQVINLAQEKLSAERQAQSQELQGKKELIDQQLSRITADLQQLNRTMQQIETGRSQRFGQLDQQLVQIQANTAQLTASTNNLKQILGSKSARGQWGERVAEDILRLAGFVEGISYRKQQVLAVHTSLIEPLPHQITAVYGQMLPRQPLRYLLADDPGAGKTIMAGLFIKELMLH